MKNKDGEECYWSAELHSLAAAIIISGMLQMGAVRWMRKPDAERTSDDCAGAGEGVTCFNKAEMEEAIGWAVWVSGCVCAEVAKMSRAETEDDVEGGGRRRGC